MAKFTLLLLVCALVVIAHAEEEKKAESPLDDVKTALETELNRVKGLISESIDAKKLEEFVNKLGERTKEFINKAQADFQDLSAKKE